MFLLLVVLAGIAGASARNFYLPSDRIVGGDPITIEQRPFQASIVLFGNHFCGGSIIKEDVILTAAHCITGLPLKYLQVRVGSTYRTGGGQLIDVRRIEYHEKYTDSLSGFDVGLIWLVEPLEFNEQVQMVSLPTQDQVFADDAMSIVSGWGRLESGGSLPDVLQQVSIPLVNHGVCTKAYRGWVTEYMICAGVDEGGKDACQLDSGGPLTVGDIQVGIVSFGYECAVPHYAGVYTNIARFRNWIDWRIAENKKTNSCVLEK